MVRAMRRVTARVLIPVLAVMLWSGGVAAQAADFPYVNNFDSTGLPNASAQFSLDAANGVFNYVSGGGTIASTAAEEVVGVGSSNFIVSSKFTINQNAGTAGELTIGFGALSSSATFVTTSPNAFYLADWTITTAVPNAGRLRILSQGNAVDFAGVTGDSDGGGTNGSSIIVGATYELRLSGVFSDGTLSLTLEVLDADGNVLGTPATATDASPLAGTYFGLRNRTAHTGHAVNISYDDYQVRTAGQPSVNAGPDQQLSLSVGVANLAGLVTDDGLPNPPGMVQTLWSVDSQPASGNAAFGNAAAVNTTVTFSAAGKYVLRLSACDDGTPDSCGSAVASDTMTLVVEGFDTWDGGSPANDNWSSAQNWINDELPDFAAGAAMLEFAGSTRPAPNNDVSGADVFSLAFAENAVAFSLGGNGLTVRDLIVNNSANLQTISLASVALGDGATIQAKNGPLDVNASIALPGDAAYVTLTAEQALQIDGPITGAIRALAKNGPGVLTLSNNASNYTGLTEINQGDVAITAGHVFGDATPVPYADAVGDAGGNTVQTVDGSAIDWFAAGSFQDSRWGLREDFGHGMTVYECSTEGFLEDCPELRTTISGLTTGQSYPVYVNYWSRATQDWAIRAGLAQGGLSLFDRTGTVHGSETATAGTPTGAVSLTLIELQAYLGDAVADANGQITVYVDDVPSATSGEVDRTWYDGVHVGREQGTLVAGGTTDGRLVLPGGVVVVEPLTLAGRTTGLTHIASSGAGNTLAGPLTLRGTGSYLIESQSGTFSIAGDVLSVRGGGALELHGTGDGVVSGSIGGGAGLTKADAGVWTLAGINSYVGNTTVSAGTLKLQAAGSSNNIAQSATVTLEMGGELDVTGLSGGNLLLAGMQRFVSAGTVVGGLTAGPGSTLAVVDTVVPQSTITNGLTLQDGAAVQMGLGLSSDLIRITGGTVTGSGPAGVSVTIVNKFESLTEGVTYTLIDWTGATAVGVEPEDFVLSHAAMLGTFSVVGNTLRFKYEGIDPTANQLMNPDFEKWFEPPTQPQYWVFSGTPGLARVPGFDGNGYAVELSNVGGNAVGQGLAQTADGKITGPFIVEMDFAFGSGTSDRVFNVQVRHGSGRIRINMRTAVDPGNPAGPQTLDFFDRYASLHGGGTVTWRTAASGLLPSDFGGGTVHPYHLTIVGDTTTDDMFVTVTDLTSGTDVITNFDAGTMWDIPPSYDVADPTYGPEPGLNHMRLETQRITGAYRVDNIVLAGRSATNGRFDFDGNGAIDNEDLGTFLQCSTGPEVAGPPAGCDPANFLRADDDNDSDVDMDDFAAFQRCLSVGGTADPACL